MKEKSYVKNGVLYCFYEIANFEEVITEALKEHNLEPGKIQIICKPVEKPERCKHGMMSAEVCHFCKGGKPTKNNGGSLPEWLKTK